MKIVCLVKQVPRADSIEFDPETKSLRREGVPLLLNPFDAGELELGMTGGVPGNFEQLTGFVKAKVIVAINRDGAADMLQAADVGLVGDHREVLRPLLDAVL